MLQQTRIATVIPFYDRFLHTFPNVTSLAAAPLENILEVWSGLGYYRRARLLHAAAQKIVTEFRGVFPLAPEQAKSLPGIGSYSAAAVLSMAYGVPMPALDGNVARVVARLDARKGSLSQPVFRKAVETRLASLISRRSPGDFNQALMELGQIVCLPRAPRCDKCPLRPECRARQLGNPEDFPSPRTRRSSEQHHLAAALVFDPNGPRAPGRRWSPAVAKIRKNTVMLVRGLDNVLMTDLWNFPAAFGASPAAAKSRLGVKLAALGVCSATVGVELARLRHTVTYRDIQVRVYRADAGRPRDDGIRWISLSEIRRAAVSQLARKIAAAIPPGFDAEPWF